MQQSHSQKEEGQQLLLRNLLNHTVEAVLNQILQRSSYCLTILQMLKERRRRHLGRLGSLPMESADLVLTIQSQMECHK